MDFTHWLLNKIKVVEHKVQKTSNLKMIATKMRNWSKLNAENVAVDLYAIA